jgi:hypothetical protein
MSGPDDSRLGGGLSLARRDERSRREITPITAPATSKSVTAVAQLMLALRRLREQLHIVSTSIRE